MGGVVAVRLREAQQLAPFSTARCGRDWEMRRDGSTVQFEALTPEGAVYLAELREVGFFDAEIAYT